MSATESNQIKIEYFKKKQKNLPSMHEVSLFDFNKHTKFANCHSTCRYNVMCMIDTCVTTERIHEASFYLQVSYTQKPGVQLTHNVKNGVLFAGISSFKDKIWALLENL